jgi:mono/diheme cytochrome c family protein
LVVAALALVGCSRGSYPLDFFSEMHYAQSFRTQEPPSLSAPADSVPVTGREVDYTVVQAQALENPVPETEDTARHGATLYNVNCAMCHGDSGTGDGPMRERLAAAEYFGVPADLTGAGPTSSKSDGELFLIITKGFGGAYFGDNPATASRFLMPPYRKLLTEEDRWILVSYIRSLQ